MNQSDDDDPFTRALRLDLPEPKDEARVRARLVSAGVLAGAVVAPSAAAGAAAVGGGLTAKLVALPLALKVGASLALLGVAAVPVWSRVSASGHEAPHSRAAASSSPAPRAVAPPVATVATHSEPSVVTASAPEASSPAVAPVAVRVSAPVARTPEKTPPQAAPAKMLPAVASFTEDAPAPLDEGSLRAETALMERALGALKRGDRTTARRELSEHQARFPNGHLVRERERALERLQGKESEHDSK